MGEVHGAECPGAELALTSAHLSPTPTPYLVPCLNRDLACEQKHTETQGDKTSGLGFGRAGVWKGWGLGPRPASELCCHPPRYWEYGVRLGSRQGLVEKVKGKNAEGFSA